MSKLRSEPTLDELFDSRARIRILNFFLNNPERSFNLKTIAGKLHLESAVLRKHIKKLRKMNFLKSYLKNREREHSVNPNFGFYEPLQDFFIKTSFVSKAKMLEKIKYLGNLKLVLLSGIFINSENSKADLLIVGDNIKSSRLNRFLSNLEAETGRELNYVVMNTKEFNYRHSMYDRFVRDLLEFKHEKLINKLKI